MSRTAAGARTAAASRMAVRDFVASPVFNGTNTYIVSGSNTGITGTHAFTVVGWHYFNVVDGSQRTLWSLGANAVGSPYLELKVTTNLLSIGVGGVGNIDSTFKPLPNTWYHIGFRFTGSAVQFVVDGVQVSTGGSGSINITDGVFRFGTYLSAAVNFLYGLGKQAAVYDSVLTDAEILAIRNKGIYPTANKKIIWEMNEATGTSIADTSGNGNTGTLSGGSWQVANLPTKPRFAVRNFASSLIFNGSNTTLVSNSDPGISGSQAFSEAAWFYNSAFSGASQVLMALGKTGGAFDALVYVLTSSQTVYLSVPGVGNINTGVVLTGLRWFLFELTFDGTTVKLYLNGKEVYSAVMALSTSADSRWRLGISYDGVSAPWNGYIVQGVLANAAYSAAQAFSLYNDGIIPAANRKIIWQLGEGSGSVATDTSGNGNNGTITNGTWQGTNVPILARTAA